MNWWWIKFWKWIALLTHSWIGMYQGRATLSMSKLHRLSILIPREIKWKSSSSASPKVCISSVSVRSTSRSTRVGSCVWRSVVASWLSRSSLMGSRSQRWIEFRGMMWFLASEIKFSFKKLQLWNLMINLSPCQSKPRKDQEPNPPCARS